jgi:hypothetical protein
VCIVRIEANEFWAPSSALGPQQTYIKVKPGSSLNHCDKLQQSIAQRMYDNERKLENTAQDGWNASLLSVEQRCEGR